MNAYKDQYISIMGDSMSTFEGYLPEGYPSYYNRRNGCVTGVFGPDETWWGRVIAHFEAQLLVNNSWSGSCVCRPPFGEIESYGCSDARTGGLGYDGLMPDHILVLIGTNDRGYGLPLTSEDKTDLAVMDNAYGLMLDKMRGNYPRATIWCCTFPITTSSRDPYFRFPATRAGEPMENFGKMVRRVATKRGCRVIELWDEDRLCDTAEGLHPNYDGMKMIADKVIAAMEQADA